MASVAGCYVALQTKYWWYKIRRWRSLLRTRLQPATFSAFRACTAVIFAARSLVTEASRSDLMQIWPSVILFWSECRSFSAHDKALLWRILFELYYYCNSWFPCFPVLIHARRVLANFGACIVYSKMYLHLVCTWIASGSYSHHMGNPAVLLEIYLHNNNSLRVSLT